MPTEFITADSTGEGIQIERSLNDANLVIDTGVLLGSANNNAVVLKASFHDVLLRGTIAGYGAGITFGAQGATQQANALRIAEDGLLQGEVNGATFWGSGRADNLGTVWAGTTGLQVNLAGTHSFRLVNDGTISGGREGVWAVGGAGTKLAIHNRGLIEGGDYSVRGFGNGDTLVNRGTLRGDVLLHDGDDRYDGRWGILEDGEVDGGQGADTFLPGTGDETINGGGGFDTLDFRGSAGLRVSLADDSGTGRAEGDTYYFIERVLGSRSGNDTLIGHHASETLEGFGGADRLIGGEGADNLRGGAGIDSLTGGLGNDVFYFSRPDEGGDVVTDFAGSTGNNDRFQLRAEGFYLARANSLDPALFVTRTSDNLAQESDDRFVFRLSDRTLWHDANGKAAGGLTLLADLQDGATVTASDFELV